MHTILQNIYLRLIVLCFSTLYLMQTPYMDISCMPNRFENQEDANQNNQQAQQQPMTKKEQKKQQRKQEKQKKKLGIQLQNMMQE